MSSWFYYSLPLGADKGIWQIIAALVLISLITQVGRAEAELVLELESGPGRAGELSWSSLVMSYRGEGDQRAFELMAEGLEGPDGVDLGALRLNCGPVASAPIEACDRGRLAWRLDAFELDLEADLSWRQQADAWSVRLVGESWQLQAEVPQADPLLAELALDLSGFELADLPAMFRDTLGLSLMIGRVDGQLRMDQGRVRGDLEIADLGFDSLDGSFAGEGLAVGLALEVEALAPERPFSLNLVQSAGEALFGPLYLPAPEAPLELELAGSWPSEQRLELSRITLDDPNALSFEGRAELALEEEGWQPVRLGLEQIDVILPLAWARWLDGPAAGAGFSGIDSSGRIEASLDWQRDGPVRLEAVLDDLVLDDSNGRLGLESLSGNLVWADGVPEVELAWNALALYGLQFGPASLSLDATADGVRLRRPMRMPLLDGAVVLDRLRWRPDDPEYGGLEFDARIEPLSLSALTEQLGWPSFGGQLAGEFPGVRFADDVLQFTGGIDVQAFSGQISIENLSIERPFGTLPALTAEIEFSRLDLLELTGAFNFGRMEGQLSGWARRLRLLDWRPVAMDARVFTHDDARRRRISQRAVDNLSQLGGAGGALLTGTVLRVFDDFPYQRAGLACRLANNICHIDGVARHDSGGFYIVQGRSLPRLDIIGHRRLVDWPQLMGQIEAMLEDGP